MTDRTFKQYAQGYGSEPCQVVFTIDGNTMYNGTVTTLDEPLPSLPNVDLVVDNVGWTWQDDVEFSGSKSVSITVAGSTLLLAGTLANNPLGLGVNFYNFYSTQIDGVMYSDPFTEESIDGVPQSGPYDPSIPGQWWWIIPAGSTFTANLHVQPPAPPNPA